MTHLKEGDKAPIFTGINQDSKPISLLDYQNKKLILYFNSLSTKKNKNINCVRAKKR